MASGQRIVHIIPGYACYRPTAAEAIDIAWHSRLENSARFARCTSVNLAGRRLDYAEPLSKLRNSLKISES